MGYLINNYSSKGKVNMIQTGKLRCITLEVKMRKFITCKRNRWYVSKMPAFYLHNRLPKSSSSIIESSAHSSAAILRKFGK